MNLGRAWGRRRLAVGAGCLLAWAGAVSGPPQTVYRCGPEGRVYSQTPCIDGRAVTADDPRSAGQHKAAREVAARDAQQAQQLADERRQREAAVKGQAAAGIKSPSADAAASAPPRKPKAKQPVVDSNMSPSMRMPAPSPASK